MRSSWRYKLAPIHNPFGLVKRFLLARNWYTLAQITLLTLGLSSLYITLMLSLSIPMSRETYFSFFRRGGLEATTDLLIFASASLFVSVLIIMVLSMRMQVRLSWQSNRDAYRLLMQIGLSKSELRHILRLEGLILFTASLPLSYLTANLMNRFIVRHWIIEEYKENLSQTNGKAIFLTIVITLVLIEWSRSNLARKLRFKADDEKSVMFTTKTRSTHTAKRAGYKRIKQRLTNEPWIQNTRSVLADLVTLAISFTLIFFIFSTKAGIRRPLYDRIAPAVAFDLYTTATKEHLSQELAQLLTDMVTQINLESKAIFLKTDARVSMQVDPRYFSNSYRQRLEKELYHGNDLDLTSPFYLDFQVYPLSKEDYNELFDLDQTYTVIQTGMQAESKIEAISYESWQKDYGALIVSDINYNAADKIMSEAIVPFDLDHEEKIQLQHAKQADLSYTVMDLIEDVPWFIDPISNSINPILLIPEADYADLFSSATEQSWNARLRVNEANLISFNTIVERDWTRSNTSLRVENHTKRRMEQDRIHSSLDLLFDMTLVFVSSFFLVQLIAFTQGQYFIRQNEFRLLRQLGSSNNVERQMVRKYCLRVYTIALLLSFILTYLAAFIWNRAIRPITAVSISWPLLPLFFITLGTSTLIVILTSVRFKKREDF